MVVIYELEDKICCISKLQIDRDFSPLLFLRHEIQEYKTKVRSKIGKYLIQSYEKLYTVALKCDSPNHSMHTLM